MPDTRLLYLVIGLVLGLSLAFAPALIKRFKAWYEGPTRSVVYRSVDGHELRLQVFDAQGAAPGGAPALLLFHGGRWQYGAPDAFYPQCRVLARAGVSCVSVEYRIGSRHGTDPRDAVRDARAALAWLRSHAAELGIDPARIAVGGGSSGGHLAAALGVPVPLDSPPPAPRPAALVLFNPMLDLSPCTPDHHLVADYWADVSPLQHVDAAVPPTLVLLGTADAEVPVGTAQAFCDAVTAQGGRCELALFEGAKHGFFNESVGGRALFDAANERVIAFLRNLGWLPSP